MDNVFVYTTDGSDIPLRPAQMLNQQDETIAALRARVAKLTSLLTEAVAEIEADIESKYEAADVLAYPSMARKYEQDMDLPRRIRAALQEGE